MAKRSFSRFVEEEAGKFPHFVLFAVLEWLLIILLFADGLLAWAANEFARLFGLRAPCLFCTRIDHVLVRRDRDFYFNASLCVAHKKAVSSLAYCHDHRSLSDIRRMCEACLLSFAAADKQPSDGDTYNSLLGILHKDLEDDGLEIRLGSSAEEAEKAEKSEGLKCSCCGEALRKKARPSLRPKGRQCGGVAAVFAAASAPAPSPRAASRFSMRRRGSEIRGLAESELEVVGGDGVISSEKLREDIKAAMVPLLAKEPDHDPITDDTNKTPNFLRNNRFFGIPLTDSATNSPRLTARALSRKSPLDRTELASQNDTTDPPGGPQNDNNMDSILVGLKRQVRVDRKSLMALYAELDEERSASAVAANNAMAMITRLQAEKAAVQMEALQYQRVMEEQFEYDQEALQETNDLLLKREEEVRALEAELVAYRERFGCLEDKEDGIDGEEEGESLLKDFKEEKTYMLGRKKMDFSRENGVGSLELLGADDEIIDTSST